MTDTQCAHIRGGISDAFAGCPQCMRAEIERLRGEAEIADEQLAQLRGFAEAHKTCRGSDEPKAQPDGPNQDAICCCGHSYKDHACAVAGCDCGYFEAELTPEKSGEQFVCPHGKDVRHIDCAICNPTPSRT